MLRRLGPVSKNVYCNLARSMGSTNTPIATPEESDVIFTEFGKRVLITLNRPKQLNAFSKSMVDKLYPKLTEYDKTKELIVIEGCGKKAFCAGGDVVALTQDKTGKTGKDYFRAEYTNNGRIASLKVPYVALINGIVMGGGVGLSVHGKYRVATETSLFAMPETQIGLFPDVGVSYFLSRLPKAMGMFLALTGYRLKAYDLCRVGIATHFCHTSLIPDLKNQLLFNNCDIEEVLQTYTKDSLYKFCDGRVPEFTLCKHVDLIEKCFTSGCVEEIIKKLKDCNNDFSVECLKSLCRMSPTSLKVTHKQILQAANLSVFETLNVDFRIGSRMLEAPDFFEGVRALLVDKDKKPKWSPLNLHDVTAESVDKYFESLGSEELNLPMVLDQKC